MSVDVVVTATAFMDITFIGLESVPRPGEERFAGDLLRSPGGGAINAIGAARLGLRAALAVPLGDDLDGRFIREALEREGVVLATSAGGRTPTTVVMPYAGERAMVTYEPGVSTSLAEVAAFSPRAAVVALDQLDIVPPGAYGYATCGDDDARAFAGHPPADLGRARAVFVNRREALMVTGAGSPEEAAQLLGAEAEIAIVTLGPRARWRGRTARSCRCPASPWRRWTRRARATCCAPRSSGRTSRAPTSSLRCGGRCCTDRCR